MKDYATTREMLTKALQLTLLKTLAIWSLAASDAVQAIIKECYKQTRHEDDKNQPLSVQPWGRDGYRRTYWLVEGQDDTHFRLYRENNGSTSKTNTWFSIAGSIEEVQAVATKLDEENTPHARTLRDRIRAAVPRFEAGEEKRRRRDYRIQRRAQFTRPEPGFSLYEGRTRGKRMRYTYSDGEEDDSDALSSRRSNRQSGISTPAEHSGPTVTASGRQVKSRVGGMYGETMLLDQRKELESGREVANGEEHGSEVADISSRPRRTTQKVKPSRGRDDDISEDDEESEAASTGDEWSGNDEEPDDDPEPDFEGDDEEEEDDEDKDMSEMDEDEEDLPRPSLVVQLRYKKSGSSPSTPAVSTSLTNRHQASEQQIEIAWHSKPQPVQAPPVLLSPMPNYPSVQPGRVEQTTSAQALMNGIHPAPQEERPNETLPQQSIYQPPQVVRS